jgi:hypothetical protein
MISTNGTQLFQKLQTRLSEHRDIQGIEEIRQGHEEDSRTYILLLARLMTCLTVDTGNNTSPYHI